MLSFTDFIKYKTLKEAFGSKAVVFAFGRFNPVTQGHKKLMDIMVQEANKRNCAAMLFLSHSQDSKKNPLPYQDKIRFVRAAAPSRLSVVESPARSVFDALGSLGSLGYTTVYFIAGDDRSGEYAKFQKYKSDLGIENIEIVSSGARGTGADLSNVENVSATKLRELAALGKEEEFIKFSALADKPQEAKKMYLATRKGLGL